MSVFLVYQQNLKYKCSNYAVFELSKGFTLKKSIFWLLAFDPTSIVWFRMRCYTVLSEHGVKFHFFDFLANFEILHEISTNYTNFDKFFDNENRSQIKLQKREKNVILNIEYCAYKLSSINGKFCINAFIIYETKHVTFVYLDNKFHAIIVSHGFTRFIQYTTQRYL